MYLLLVDETKQPGKRVPKAMVSSTIFNAVLILAYAIVILYYLGNYEAVSASPTNPGGILPSHQIQSCRDGYDARSVERDDLFAL